MTLYTARMMFAKKIRFVLIVVFILSGCRDKKNVNLNDMPDSNQVAEVESEAKMQRYEGKGMVLSITPNKKQIIINHEDIPGFMEAMTMPFNVPDSSLLEGISARDSILLSIDYDGTTVILKEIKNITRK